MWGVGCRVYSVGCRVSGVGCRVNGTNQGDHFVDVVLEANNRAVVSNEGWEAARCTGV